MFEAYIYIFGVIVIQAFNSLYKVGWLAAFIEAIPYFIYFIKPFFEVYKSYVFLS
jgi:hypothetical protein